MKIGTIRLAIGLLTALAACANPLPAQELVPPAQIIPVMPTVEFEPAKPRNDRPSELKQVGYVTGEEQPAQAPVVDFAPAGNADAYHFWARLEYLRWYVTRPPVAVPLLSTNAPPAIGALNEAGTTVLFGAGSGQDATFGSISGGRLTIGGWLEKNYEYGWELTGFFLEQRNSLFNANTPGGAAAIISLPFNAVAPFTVGGIVNPAGETSLSAGGAPTDASVLLKSQLWGMELNELVYLWANDYCYITGVLGLRYLGLSERLTLNYTTLDPANNGALTVTDDFNASNHYAAAQLGARFGGTVGRFTWDTAMMFMAGPLRQIVQTTGTTTVTGGAFGFADGATAAGLFAEPSNFGSHERNVVAYGTEMQFKLGFAVTPRLQPFIGYNLLYVNNVARPGNQIDRNINITQNPFFVPPGTLAGETAPAAPVIRSEFWAHGVQVGVELRY